MADAAIYSEGANEWRWERDISMSDAVRLTTGVHAFIVQDNEGFCCSAGGSPVEGDIAHKYKKTVRALRSQNKRLRKNKTNQ